MRAAPRIGKQKPSRMHLNACMMRVSPDCNDLIYATTPKMGTQASRCHRLEGERDRFFIFVHTHQNAIERLHEEFKRRIMTQTALP
jgi:hypothetical protein